MEGRIDPATIVHGKKVIDLEDKIEWWVDSLKTTAPGTPTYKTAEKLITKYAIDYKELTGDYYRRNI